MQSVYQSHFGLVREPFNITPDPNFFYPSASHREALAQLIYGINARKGFVVLTGEVGTGKTTLIHALLQELNGNVQTALVFNIIENPTDLLRYLCDELGLTTPQKDKIKIRDYLAILNEFLLKTYKAGGNVSLIIDEAQNLSTEVLESIRLLSNFETSREKLIQILMVGQPELSLRLNAPELRQLKQRVVLRYQLKPLSFSECNEYISNRIEVAGGTLSLFSSKALETIYHYSGGTPRLVNILCDNGLLTAFGSGRKRVEGTMIKEVAQELYLNAPQVVDNTHTKDNSNNLEQTNGANDQIIKGARKWLRALFYLGALSLILGGVAYFAISILPNRPALLRDIVENFKVVLKK